MTLFGDDPEPYYCRIHGIARCTICTPVKPATRDEPPKWTANTTRARCDHCQRDLVAGRRDKPAMTAKWRRKHDGVTLLLCYQCARPVRDKDGT